jgi:hypothetical protein
MFGGAKSPRFCGRLGARKQRGFLLIGRARALLPGGEINPLSAFTGGKQGWWREAADPRYGPVTMWQDSAGTTPVTAVEQPVGLVLDRKHGLARGAELTTNSGFDTDTVWTKGLGWTISGGASRFETTGAAATLYHTTAALVAGNAYEVTIVVSAITAGGVFGRFEGGTAVAGTPHTTVGTHRSIMFAVAGNTQLGIRAVSTTTGLVVDSVSIKELPGNHNIQATAADRPVLSARYNLLTKSDQLADAVWTYTNTVPPVAPDAAGLFKLNETAVAAAHEARTPTVAYVSGVGYAITVDAKAGERNFLRVGFPGAAFAVANTFAVFDLTTGQVAASFGGVTATKITPMGGGEYRCQVWATATASASSTCYIGPNLNATTGGASYLGVAGSGLYLRCADVRLADDAAKNIPAYQRVNTTSDYDTEGFPHYFRLNGTNQSWATAGTVDFSGTDKVTLAYGVTKLSDAAAGILVELSVSWVNPGTVSIFAPESAGANYGFALDGSAIAGLTATTFAAPTTSVLATTYDLAGPLVTDEVKPRINGAIPAIAVSTAGPAGTGNFGNYTAYTGRRGGSSLPFNGRIYSEICVGASLPASQLAALERYAARRMGVQL